MNGHHCSQKLVLAEKLLTEEDLERENQRNFEYDEEDYCLPSYTKVSRKGEVRVKFTRNLMIDDLSTF